jgi:tetratricopeptide (TPR) repeat protein
VALGLLDMQMNDLDAAETHLKAALEGGQSEDGQIKMYLGQLNEGRRKYEEALRWYEDVDDDQFYLEARLRAAVVLGKMKRVDEGRALLQSLAPKDAGEQTQIIQAEAQMLREAGDFEGAYEALSKGLEKMPESPDLLYDRAMVAERLNRLDVLEKDLRLLIKLKPDYAHAYNALGYTLADRTPRLAEAIELLEKAIKLAPNDPFIQDSMGWALFKAKRLDESISYLKRAYDARPDPEIAAHLGEALWAKGDKEQARRIWEGSIKEHPDNESLRETISRLHP